jgi:predicted O-methyltransferase YrrM
MSKKLFKQVDRYIENLLGKEDKALKSAVRLMSKNDIPPMNVSANQGKFLQVLARMANAKRILEIGACGGYSTIWLARSLPVDGHLITLEIDKDFAAVARESIIKAGLDTAVDIRVGKAIDLLHEIEAEDGDPFDMIFIDADKPPYAEYFDFTVKLSRPGTVIVADNVVREGKILDEKHADEKVQGVRRLNASLATDSRVVATIIQTVGVKYHDGMAIAVVL